MVAERFSRQPIIHAEGLIAQGAAFYAMRLGMTHVAEAALISRMESDKEAESAVALVKVANPVEALEDSVKEEHPQEERAANLDKPKQPVVLSLDFGVTEQPRHTIMPSTTRPSQPDVASLEDVLMGRERLFQHARQLVAQGLHDRAEGFLQGLIQDAQIMLDMMPSRPMPIKKREIEQAFQLSDELLESGRFQQGVEHAHYAYTLDPENPEVFQRMIDIHCRAAMALLSIDGYKKSMEWLNCALSHDRTNTLIHERIAERHFIHAQQMLEQDHRDEALRAVEQCLYFNPENAEANQLRAALLKNEGEPHDG
jgi:tetratricopeptide (TPR) repeat protein